MLTSLIELLSYGLGQAMSWFMNIFLSAMDLSMDTYLEYFPFFRTAYNILKGFSWGLLLIVAGTGLALFFFGAFDGGAIQERPAAILVRSFVAGSLIVWGGYILVFLVNLAVIPFDTFLKAESGSEFGWNIDLTALSVELAAAASGQAWLLMGDLAIALLDFFLMLLIAWNLFKLIIEVAERYLMVGVLVFTAPIVYPTLATKNTSSIFRRWISMFAGSLIIMSLSALFLKLIVSGFTLGGELTGSFNAGAKFIFKLVLILAMCKIAQRVDSYMQQLGIGVATTGGSMLDDALMAFRTIQSSFGGRGGIGPDGLPMGGGGGGRGAMGKLGDFYRATSPFAAGRKAAAEAYKSGQGVWGSIKTGAAAVGSKMKSDYQNNSIPGRIKKASEAASAQGKRLSPGGALKAGGSVLADNTVAVANPRAYAEHQAAQKVDAAANQATYQEKLNSTPAPGNSLLSDDAAKAALDGKTRPQDFAANYENHGINDPATGVPLRKDENGDFAPTAEFAAAGGVIDTVNTPNGPSWVIGAKTKEGQTAANDAIAQGYTAEGRQMLRDALGENTGARTAPINGEAQAAYSVMEANTNLRHAQQQLEHTESLIQNYQNNGQAVPEHLMETRQQQQAALVDSSKAYQESLRSAGVSNVREAGALYDSQYQAAVDPNVAAARVAEWKQQDEALVSSSRAELARRQADIQVAEHAVNDANTDEQRYAAMQQLHTARESYNSYQNQVSDAKDRLETGYYDRNAGNVYEERTILPRGSSGDIVDLTYETSARNSSVYACSDQLQRAHQYNGTDKVFEETSGPAVIAAQQVFGSAAPVVDQAWANLPQAQLDTRVSGIRIESLPPVEIDGQIIQQGTRYTVSYSNPVLSTQSVDREFLDPVAFSALPPVEQAKYIDFTDGAGNLWKTLPDTTGQVNIEAPRQGPQSQQVNTGRTNWGNQGNNNRNKKKSKERD